MKRPWLMRVTVALHALIGLACLVVVVLVVRETRNPRIVEEGKETLHGLYLGAWVVGGVALVYGAATLGLWKRWRWAWWLSVIVDVLLTVVFLYGPIVEHDWEDAEIGIAFPLLGVSLLLPQVRNFIFKRQSADVQTSAAEGAR